jgi:hypothetical protein
MRRDNTMYILIAVILISVLFERQARKHRLEESSEFKRLGIPVPAERPRLQKLESCVAVWIGLMLFAIGGALVASIFGLGGAELTQATTGENHKLMMRLMEPAAASLAAGVALVFLGVKSVLMKRE